MNQNYFAGIRANENSNPSYIPNQSTYPPYMNMTNSMPNTTNTTTTTPITPAPQYAENLFRMNRGKKVKVYFSYPDSVEWRDRIFEGIILESGRDYLLLKDEQNKINLLWLVYINYAVFEDEEISY